MEHWPRDSQASELPQPIQYECPLPLVKAGVYLIIGSFSWVEFTQLLRAGLGSTAGLNLQCSHPPETEASMHTTIKEMLSIQHKQKLPGDKFSSCVCG